MQPRHYQIAARDATYKFFRLNKEDCNPVLVLPTGTGKSLILKMIAEDVVNKRHGRCMILAHRKELLAQTGEKIDGYVTAYSASLGQKNLKGDIVLGQIQSIHRKAREVGDLDLVMVDEAHLVSPDEETMFASFLAELRNRNPKMRMVGLTATPYRMKEGSIVGPEGPFHAIAYEYPIAQAVQEGYLTPLVSVQPKQHVSHEGLHVRAGEYVTSEVEERFTAIIAPACQEILAYTADRNHVLVFCASRKHAHIVAEALGGRCVTGDMATAERDKNIADFKAGQFKFLVNVDVLTTGFDATLVDAIAMLRSTFSRGLFLQICGRGMRLHAGKTDCIAEGQLVLTNQGEVPIENVTTDMKVWDGVEFVNHDGAICKGIQSVIEYAGLVATPDHRVWTKEGWKTLGECAVEQAEIAATGNGRQAIREADGLFVTHSLPKDGCRSKSPVRADNVHAVRSCFGEVLSQHSQVDSRMQTLRPAEDCRDSDTSLAVVTLPRCKGPLHEPEQHEVCRLRRAWYPVSVQDTEGHGDVSDGTLPSGKTPANRPNQQRRSLCDWEPSDGCRESQHVQPECRHSERSGDAQVQDTAPGSEVRGRDNRDPAASGADIRGNQGQVLQPGLVQAQRRVWDILNAGPRHRFTCQGLLVSNCAFLDFGGNVRKHGPIDAPYEAPRKVWSKESTDPAEVMAKDWLCPECGLLNSTGFAKCDHCDFVRTRPIQHEVQAAHEAIMLSAGIQPKRRRWEDVDDVRYYVHIPRDPEKPRSLLVEYRIAESIDRVREWVCFEHEGYARKKAEQWWGERSEDPVPASVDEAQWLADAGSCAKAIRIQVDSTEKFPRVVGYDLGLIPPRIVGEDGDWTQQQYEMVDEEDIPF